MPLHPLKADDETYEALMLAQRQYEAAEGRRVNMIETLHWLCRDARPDLFGDDPPLRFSTLTQRQRRRARWLLGELLQRNAHAGEVESPDFGTMIDWLMDQLPPDQRPPDFADE